MKSQRTGGHLEASGNMACWHAVRARLYEQAENIETIVLRQRSEDRYRIGTFHISIKTEIFRSRQGIFQRLLKCIDVKQTCRKTQSMSLLGVKRTQVDAPQMSAFDPKRTF
jgi:hypothetical protein